MSHMLTFSPGWQIPMPAGTMLIRLDIAFKTRPGAGGYAMIIEASDLDEIVLIRGSQPQASTEDLVDLTLANLAKEVAKNRAVILTRNNVIAQKVSERIKPFRMLRVLGSHPLAVADATRHASVMAERADYVAQPQLERMVITRTIDPEDFDKINDAAPILRAIGTLVNATQNADLDNTKVLETANKLLSAGNESRLRMLARRLTKLVKHDIATPTKLD